MFLVQLCTPALALYWISAFNPQMGIAIGLKTKTHVFICSETNFGESIVKVKEAEKQTERIGNVLINLSGKQADAMRVASYGKQSTLLMANNYRTEITPALVSSVVATHIHAGLRSSPFQCSAIIGGINESATELFAVDQYGASHQDNFVVTGYGTYFLYGLYDAYYGEDMHETEARHFLALCLKTLKDRLMLDTSKWVLDIVSTAGEFTTEDVES